MSTHWRRTWPPSEEPGGPRDLRGELLRSRMRPCGPVTRCGWSRPRWCGSLGVGARRFKTDRRDAQLLSEVSTRIDLPSVHIPSEARGGRPSVS